MIKGLRIILRPIHDEDWSIIEEWGKSREALWGAFQRFQLDHIPALRQAYQQTGLLRRESGVLLIETLETLSQRLEIQLPQPLPPGGTVTITMNYGLFLPPMQAYSNPNEIRPQIYGYSERQTNFVDRYGEAAELATRPGKNPYVPLSMRVLRW
jgi:hypothetical protein